MISFQRKHISEKINKRSYPDITDPYRTKCPQITQIYAKQLALTFAISERKNKIKRENFRLTSL